MSQLTLVKRTGRADASGFLVSRDVSQVRGTGNVQGILGAGHSASSATRLASLLSHDIRHQLSVIYCNAEFLSDAGTLQADRQQLFDEVRGAIADATRILDFILLHAKGVSPAAETAASLKDLIQETVAAVRPHPHAAGVSINIGEFSSLYALFSPTLVGSAVYNLLLNACFAAQQAGRPARVDITVRTTHQYLYILVKDNGVGVPAEVRKSLFTPFVTRDKTNGTGLGTTIADYVAREYGGQLQLEESSPGCTIFALTFSKALLSLMEHN